jgi:parallel beta-helix repeat protein
VAVRILVTSCIVLVLLQAFIPAQAARVVSTPLEDEAVSFTIHISGNTALLEMAAEYGWEGTGTKDNPVVIEGYTFRSPVHMFTMSHIDLYVNFTNNILDGYPPTWCAVVISNTKNLIMCNNTIRYGAVGIHLISVNNSVFTKNTIHDNAWDAFFMDGGCYENTISENYLFRNGESGVWLWHGGSRNTISDNVIYSSDYGVAIQDFSVENTVFNNTIQHTMISAVDLASDRCTMESNRLLSNTGDGIRVFSRNNTITQNTVLACGRRGIYLASGSSGADITHNAIINSTQESLYCMDSDRNFMRYNDFIADSSSRLVVDSGYLNVFEWNYWGGFWALDQDRDGVFDEPKPIDGSAQNRDQYPLTHPSNLIPVIPTITPNPTTSIPTQEQTSSTTESTESSTSSVDTFDTTLGGSIVIGGVTACLAIVVLLFIRRRR